MTWDGQRVEIQQTIGKMNKTIVLSLSRKVQQRFVWHLGVDVRVKVFWVCVSACVQCEDK